MRVLALETSERIGSVALLDAHDDGVEVVQASTLPADRRSAQTLLPVLQDMLANSNCQADELDLICVTEGPGSFTGLRIGVTVAKTLAYTTGAKLVGVSTLATLAANASNCESCLWAILDAQRQEVFAACFESDVFDTESSPEVEVLSIEAWLTQLQSGDMVVGPPLEKLTGRLPEGVGIVAESKWAPQAEWVGRLGIAMHRTGKSNDPMQLVPKYYRKSAAEEKVDAIQVD